jgi:hypothetical protein
MSASCQEATFASATQFLDCEKNFCIAKSNTRLIRLGTAGRRKMRSFSSESGDIQTTRVIDVKISEPAFGGDEPAPWAGLSGETGCRPPRAWWPHAWRGPIQSAVAAPRSLFATERTMEPIPRTRFGDARGGAGTSIQAAARAHDDPELGPALLAGLFSGQNRPIEQTAIL